MTGNDPLPLARSFVERRLGEAVGGVFQFDERVLKEKVSARSLGGVVVGASGAPLGSVEFDMLVLVLQQFLDLEAPEDKIVPFNIGAQCRGLGLSNGGRQRHLMIRALVNLRRASVTLPDIDPETGEPTAVVERALFQELRIAAAPDTIKKAIREENLTVEAVSDGADGSGYLMLADWLADAVRKRAGVQLDLETQRSLSGDSKRVWVTMSVLPWAQHEDEDIESLVVLLTDDVYDALKLRQKKRSDNRITLERALKDIVASDPSYVSYEFRPHAADRRMRELVLTRCTGDARQARLRETMAAKLAAGDTLIPASSRPTQMTLEVLDA